MTDDQTSPSTPWWQLCSIVVGLVCFFAILFAPGPSDLSVTAQRLAAVSVLMAIWWMTQPIPIAATSLIPLALYPLLEINAPKEVSRAYGDQNIFLYLGGFLIAVAIENCGLHRRIALHVISWVGSSPRRIIFGFMLTTALLSMWISNTATALLMLPIALALVSTLRESVTDAGNHDATRTIDGMVIPLLLGIAYAASCGGFATLVGTPTNISLRGFWERQYVPQGYPNLEFATWMIFFVPVSLIMLLVAGTMMTWKVRPFAATSQLTRTFFRDRLQSLGPATPAERKVAAIFAATALLWIFREPLIIGNFKVLPDWPSLLTWLMSRVSLNASAVESFVQDSTIAVFMALLLFLVPGDMDQSGKRQPVLTWTLAEQRIPWGVLLLFGGGFAMADAFSLTGLSDWLGLRFANVFSGQPTYLIIAGVCLLLTFLTEFTSNTATINTMLPILAAMSETLDIDPRLLLIPATVSASCAFMLPVATPPNAIVFGTGKIPMCAMIKYGFFLNLIGVVVITAAMWITSP